MDSLDLAGGLSTLILQLTKVKGVKTKKLNSLRRIIKRFEADQNNLELWKALQLNKESANNCGVAYSILVETCVARMQEELEAWMDKDKVSPMVDKMKAAGDELRAFSEDRDKLEWSYFELAGSFHERQNSMVKSRSEAKPDTKKLTSAEAIKPSLAPLKLSPSEFPVRKGLATGWVQESNFMIADVKHLYLNAIMDKEIQLKIKALPEYVDSDAHEVLKLVEKVHYAANPLFVKRSSFYAALRAGGEAGSAYYARVSVLAGLARIKDMDHKEHVKFKVLKDLPVKIREKVLKDQDMTLDDMSVLVADVEAMDIVNNTLKSEQP